MRDFVLRSVMRPRTVLTLAASLGAGCLDTIDGLYAAGKGVPSAVEGETTGAASSSTGRPDPESTGGGTSSGGSESPDGTTSEGVDPPEGSTSADAGTTAAPLPPPSIVDFEVPSKVSAAGPMAVQLLAEHTATAEVILDGAQTFPLAGDSDLDGDGVHVFSGFVPIHGSADNGAHTLVAIARRDGLEDSRSEPFEVAAPLEGSPGWEKFTGAGSRTTRLAVTPAGEVYEAGAFEVNGLERPAIRLREPISGADLWKEGARVLDAREGAVVDLDVAPDGRVWVAMNVKEGDVSVARIAAFSPEMAPLGADLEAPGVTVQGVASDSLNGCLGIGSGMSFFGDYDVLAWRMNAAGTPSFSGYPWDYVPEGKQKHDFSDFALDVVIDKDADEAWIVGGSLGKHELEDEAEEVRGVLLHVDIDTFGLVSPVVVVPPAGAARQSLLSGAWLEAESVLVSGYQCDLTCQAQNVLATRYDFAGVPTWGYSGPPAKAANGNSIASDTHGTILIAASIQQDALKHGFLLGFTETGSEAFAPVPFPEPGPSSAESVVVGPYDWPFVGGSATKGGISQGYVLHTHP